MTDTSFSSEDDHGLVSFQLSKNNQRFPRFVVYTPLSAAIEPHIISYSTSQRDLASPDAHYPWPLAPSRMSPQTFAIALRHQRFPNGGGQHPRCMVLFSSNRGEGIAWSRSKYGTDQGR
jgi:hypothetical protein